MRKESLQLCNFILWEFDTFWSMVCFVVSPFQLGLRESQHHGIVSCQMLSLITDNMDVPSLSKMQGKTD